MCYIKNVSKSKPTMKNQTYKIQFFDGRTAEWKDIPTRLNIATLEEAKDFMNAQVEMCGGVVDFRIEKEFALN